MEFRQLGRSGLRVSVVGVGTNNFGRRLDADGARRVVDAAIESGITFFDTADVYGSGDSERFLGAAVKQRRERVIIGTKFRTPMGDGEYDRGGSRLYVRRAVEASLKRLDTEYIDLYQMHSPDASTPIEETLSTLNDLVREGKVRYVGSSNFAGWQIADADWTARVKGFEPFVSAQNHYSLLEREVEREVIPACEHFGVSMIPYFPLASGILTGKHRRGEAPAHDSRLAGPAGPSILTAANFDVVERLEDFARARGIGLLQVAIGALAAQPQVASVIAGAMNPEQVRANAKAAEWVPTLEDVAAVNDITASATRTT